MLGGTGFVGSYIADALLSAGHEVSILVREGSEHKLGRNDFYRVVHGDLSDRSALDAVVEGCDAVVYCVGILRENRRRNITFEALQYDGVVDTLEAAQRAGVGRFLLMSANGVKVPGTPYQETKRRAEDAVLASGLAATVFRPSVIFGDPRGKMEFATQLFDEMVDVPFPAVGFFAGADPRGGAVRMSPVHVLDVAAAFAVSLVNASTIGRVYELGGPEILSWPEMIRRIGCAVGRDKWIVPMPIGLMKLAALACDWLPFFPVTRDQLTMLAEGNTANPATIETLTGTSPRAFDANNLAYLAEDTI
jgi:NADH dehydrogenase